jgi:ABC-2 type transport system permease protein
MDKIWIIAKRELGSYFDSLIAYLMIIIFLGLNGFFTWLFGNNIFIMNQASLGTFFGISYWTLFFFIPAITMRTLAEENKSGTIELLSTKAVSDFQIVSGKFLGSFMLIAIALVCTTPYLITVAWLGPLDFGATFGGYLGLLFASAAYISIGILASSSTNNQIVAFLLALFVSLFFHLLFDILASGSSGLVGSIFNYLSARTHFESLSRGVIDSRDIIYFLSILSGGLVLASILLSKRNWQK